MFINIPNVLTALRLISIPFFVSFLHSHQWIQALCVLFFSSLTDVLDGYFARKLKQQTLFGERFDPVVDKIFGFFAYLALMQVSLIPSSLFYIIVGRDILILLGSLFILKRLEGVNLLPSLSGKVHTFTLFSVAIIIIIGEISPVFKTHLFMTYSYDLILFTTLWSGGDYVRRFFA